MVGAWDEMYTFSNEEWNQPRNDDYMIISVGHMRAVTQVLWMKRKIITTTWPTRLSICELTHFFFATIPIDQRSY